VADLKVEQIMVKVLALMKLTATAGADAERDRDVPVDSDNSITVEQGDDQLLDAQGNVLATSRLQVSIVAGVRKNNTYSTQINLIRKEVHVAMMAGAQDLGLPAFVLDVMPEPGAERPEVYGEGGKTVVKMAINFHIDYQYLLTDASA